MNLHMRKAAIFCSVFALSFALLAGCKNKDRTRAQTEEEAPRMATMLTMSDPRAPTQLLLGFYSLESGGWRWTAGHFTVILRPPRDAAQVGATLKLKFSLPQAVIDHVASTSVTGSVAGIAFPPETYTKAGDYEYVREIPAAAFTSDSVKVEFALSKFLAAGTVEGRELGVIATAVGFEHK
jgi:hypothetical protein